MQALAPLPLDLRIMRRLTLLCWIGAGALVSLMGGLLLARSSLFEVKAISVKGELTRVNPVGIQQAAVSSINGTTLTTDLVALRNAVANNAWIRQVDVHRQFPNRLVVEVAEHTPVATWGSVDDEDIKLLNSFGQIFEANISDVDVEALVQLSGPDEQATQVLAMYQHIEQAFQSASLEISALNLSTRGTWSVRTTTGASIQLGGGDVGQLQQRLVPFFATLPKMSEKFGKSIAHLESADLRHQDGYALKLRGVTTEIRDLKSSTGLNKTP